MAGWGSGCLQVSCSIGSGQRPARARTTRRHARPDTPAWTCAPPSLSSGQPAAGSCSWPAPATEKATRRRCHGFRGDPHTSASARGNRDRTLARSRPRSRRPRPAPMERMCRWMVFAFRLARPVPLPSSCRLHRPPDSPGRLRCLIRLSRKEANAPNSVASCYVRVVLVVSCCR